MSSELVDEWFKESPPGYVRLAELMMEREGLMMLVLALVLLLEPPQSKPRTGIQPDRTYPVSYTPLQASTASGASSEATDTELEPLTPRESIRWFLNSKKRDVSPESIDRYDTKLTNFEKYCELSSISNVNSLTGRDIERYRTWRRDESTSGALKPKTMRDEMYLFRDFIRYLESIEAVKEDLHEKVVIPQLGPNDGVKDVQLKPNRARSILDYLEKFEYASLEHVVWLLLCVTGRRLGGIHSLDVGDYHPDTENPYLAFRHRPERGTRLKNEKKGETNVNISEKTCSVLDDYLAANRPDVEDGFGRRPLLATGHGRLSKSTMRKYVYKGSRPCKITGECPHGREIADCEAAQDAHRASKCPSSRSPHAIRHGYISRMRDAGTPKPVLSERCDVSEAIIDKHYDEREEAERQELRKRILDEIFEKGESEYGS